MKKFLIATAALASVAMTMPANAADLPVKAPPVVMPELYNWSGIYIGGLAGAAIGIHDNQKCDFLGGRGPFTGIPWLVCPTGVAVLGETVIHSGVPSGTDIGHQMTGGFLGGEIGFNWETPNRWVFGLEADWSAGLPMEDDNPTCNGGSLVTTPVFLNLAGGNGCSFRINNFGTARGRIGYAFGPRGDFLTYVTGGFAWAEGQFRVDNVECTLASAAGVCLVANRGNVNLINITRDHFGGVIGSGAEYGITPYLSVKAELLWIFLDNETYQCGGNIVVGLGGRCSDPNQFARLDINSSFGVARAALNWRFNWAPYAPVVARY